MEPQTIMGICAGIWLLGSLLIYLFTPNDTFNNDDDLVLVVALWPFLLAMIIFILPFGLIFWPLSLLRSKIHGRD